MAVEDLDERGALVVNWKERIVEMALIKDAADQAGSQWEYTLPSVRSSAAEIEGAERVLGEEFDPRYRAFLTTLEGGQPSSKQWTCTALLTSWEASEVESHPRGERSLPLTPGMTLITRPYPAWTSS